MFDHKEPKESLYQIRVKGNLDTKWADWFEGFVLIPRGDGETLLSGRVADQSALHGILGKINSLGLSLIMVAQVEHLDTGHRCPVCNQQIDLTEEFR